MTDFYNGKNQIITKFESVASMSSMFFLLFLENFSNCFLASIGSQITSNINIFVRINRLNQRIKYLCQ